MAACARSVQIPGIALDAGIVSRWDILTRIDVPVFGDGLVQVRQLADLGTGREKDTDVALSTLVKQINERCGTEFTEADQLFFDQMRATAELDEKVVEDAASSDRRGTRWPVMEAR